AVAGPHNRGSAASHRAVGASRVPGAAPPGGVARVGGGRRGGGVPGGGGVAAAGSVAQSGQGGGGAVHRVARGGANADVFCLRNDGRFGADAAAGGVVGDG